MSSPTSVLAAATAVVLSLLAPSALAQQGSSTQQQEDLFAPGPPPSTRPPPPPTAPPAEAKATPPPSGDLNVGPGENDASLGDRVKSVEHKSFMKAHRFALSGFGSASINDAFFQKWGGGVGLSYAFADPFALSLHYAYFYNQTTANVQIAKEVLSSQLYATRLHSLAAADFQLTPIYGKFTLANSIVYYDLYLLAGFGAAQGTKGWEPASEVGIGERTYVNEFVSVGVEAAYVFYADAASGGPTVLQRSLLISVLVSFWFPGQLGATMNGALIAFLWLSAAQAAPPPASTRSTPQSTPAQRPPPQVAAPAAQPLVAPPPATTQAVAPPPSAGEEPPEEQSEPPSLESQIPPVSGQGFDLRGKFEITAGIGLSFDDAFFQNFMPELALGYHFSDPFYVGVRGAYGFHTSAGRVNSCSTSTGVPVCGPPTPEQLKQLPGAINGMVTIEGAWTPLSGKINLFSELVIHNDLSILLGAGAMFLQPVEGSTNPSDVPTLSPGLGFRLFFSNSIALSLEFRDYLYASGGVQNLLMFNAGLAFFL